MQPQPRVWLWSLPILCLFVCPSAGHDKPWVRAYNCGPPAQPLSPEQRAILPFWLSHFQGGLDTSNGTTTELDLDLINAYNQSLLNPDDLNVALLEKSVAFQTIGHTVGHLTRFESTCPEALTDPNWLPEDVRICSQHLTYSFPSTYQLRTLTSTPFRFQRNDGTEMVCAYVKITPHMGKSVSYALTFTPLSVLALVAFSSWQVNLGEAATSLSLLEHGRAMADAGTSPGFLLWATVRDTAAYLRHLQFLFASASLSVDYPGFYVPVVSKLAWANLLYWKGPLDTGYTYKGPEGGMYVSNGSFGMQFMTTMLGYPNMLNRLANSLANLVLLTGPLFFILLVVLFKVSQLRPSPPLSDGRQRSASFLPVAQKAAGITLGVALCFFSVPLLSYIAWDLFLTGYLPNYRIGLAVLMLLVVFGANYFFTYQIDEQIPYRLAPLSENEDDGEIVRGSRSLLSSDRLWEVTSRYLPPSVPLIQAAVVGGLQGWPVAQVSVLAGLEGLLFVYLVASTGGDYRRQYGRIGLLCSATRLITALLNMVFIASATEAAKEWVGYTILGIHGLLVLPLIVVNCLWQLYRRFWRKGRVSQKSVGRRQKESRPVADVDLRNLRPRSQAVPGKLDKRQEALPARFSEQDPSSFYRAPRSLSSTPLALGHGQGNPSDFLPINTHVRPGYETDFDIDLALSQISPGTGVDYSYRESDRFYGVLPDNATSSSSTAELNPDRSSDLFTAAYASGEPRVRLIDKWKDVSGRLRWPRQKEQEKGFSVVRPPRPPPNEEHGPL